MADHCEILHNARKCVQFYKPGPELQEASPKDFRGKKTCKIWSDFGRLQTLMANISGKDEDIQNRSST